MQETRVARPEWAEEVLTLQSVDAAEPGYSSGQYKVPVT